MTIKTYSGLIITTLSGLKIVTGKYGTSVRTPFGSFAADDHQDGIAQAQAYIARYA